MAARLDRRNRNADRSSKVDESMTMMYRLLGHIERPIGKVAPTSGCTAQRETDTRSQRVPVR
ncbi:MAG TPA: hypothetical protein VGJ96_07765 [Gemmatimonadaceae bacterium]|jgi:hypothetical protein